MRRISRFCWLTNPGFSKYACHTISTSFGGRWVSRNDDIGKRITCLYHLSNLRQLKLPEALGTIKITLTGSLPRTQTKTTFVLTPCSLPKPEIAHRRPFQRSYEGRKKSATGAGVPSVVLGTPGHPRIVAQ